MSSKRKSLPSKIESSTTNPLTEAYYNHLRNHGFSAQNSGLSTPHCFIGRTGLQPLSQTFNQDQVRNFFSSMASIQLTSSGLEPVLSRTEKKTCLSSKLQTTFHECKNKNIEIDTSFVSPALRPSGGHNTGFSLLINQYYQNH